MMRRPSRLRVMRPDTLPVNEIFFTIQGEANWTGSPSVFIRLQGCPVGCPWCDTKHTWPTAEGGKGQTTFAAIMEKTADTPSPSWAPLTADDIVGLIEQRWPDVEHFVITGGEPCLYDLTRLTFLLGERGTVQIETSGTHRIIADQKAWVTVSPKIKMPGNLPIYREALARADEIKMPVVNEGDLELLQHLIARYISASALIWVQPVSQDKWATNLCIAAAMEHGWSVSFQTHKYVGLR